MMANLQLADTLVNDHRSSLLRDAWVQRLRKRVVRAVVRTAAPATRSGNPTPKPPAAQAEPVRELQPA